MMNIFKSNKTFRNLISGEFLSLIGDVLFFPILLIIASQSSNVGLMTGLVTLSETLPILITAFIFPLMEKLHRRYYFLVGTYIFRFGIYGVVALLLRTPTDMLLIGVILLNVISDISGNLIKHTQISFISDMTQESETEEEVTTKFSQMMGVSQVVQSSSSLIGIVIGGVLISWLLPSYIAMINAGTFVLGALVISASRKSFLRYDKMKKETVDDVENRQKFQWKQVFANKKLVWIIFLTGLLNVMLTLMLFLNNLNAHHLEINQSFSAFIFVFMFISSIGMILGGLLVSMSTLKIKFNALMALIFIFAVTYFVLLLLHQSIALIVIAFIIMLLSGVIQPLLMGEILGVVGNEKIASIAVSIDMLMRLMSPLIVVLLTILTQVLTTELITGLCAALFVIISSTLIFSLFKTSNKSV